MTQSVFFCYIASWARKTDKSCGTCGIRGTLNSQSEERKPHLSGARRGMH